MPDIYNAIEEATADMLGRIAQVLEIRAADPQQKEMLNSYLAEIEFPSQARVVEIGCGTGRITKQLAGYFNEVHALDISEKMIDYAKQHIKRPKVRFHLSKGIDIPLDNQSVHSCFSTHVFQHFDSLSVAKAYFKEISRVLKPNGTLMIHLPIYKWPTTPLGFSKTYEIYNRIRNVRAYLVRLLMELKMAKPIMRGLWYPMDFFYKELPTLGFEDIEIFLFVTKSNNDPHPFVLAKTCQ